MSWDLVSSPLSLAAIGLATLGALLLLAGIVALVRGRALRFGLRTSATLLLLALAGVAGSIAVGLQGADARGHRGAALRPSDGPAALRCHPPLPRRRREDVRRRGRRDLRGRAHPQVEAVREPARPAHRLRARPRRGTLPCDRAGALRRPHRPLSGAGAAGGPLRAASALRVPRSAARR